MSAGAVVDVDVEGEGKGVFTDSFDSDGDGERVVVFQRSVEVGFDMDAGIAGAESVEIRIRNTGIAKEFGLGGFKISEDGRVMDAAARVRIGE
jgi:hypothetical protein